MAARGPPPPRADGAQSYFWLRSEVFEQGALPMSLPPTFSLASLMKIPGEVAEATRMSSGEWMNASRKCLGLPPEIAMVLFTAYEVIHHTDCAALLQGTREELAARENGQLDAFRAKKTLPLPGFLLFLFLQLYHRNAPFASPRPDSVWPQDGAPLTAAPTTPMASLSPTRAMALSARAADHEDQLQFVKRHLYDMLVLVAAGKSKMSLAQFQEFQLLLHEGETLTKDVPLGWTIPFWQKAGQPREQMDKAALVDISALQAYVTQHLGGNPNVYPPVELPVSNRASPPALWLQDTKAHVASVSGVTKSLFVRSAENMTPQLKLVRVFCNHQANIYLIMPLQHVAIFGCTNCTVVLGTVAKMVTIEHCEKVRVVCATQFLRINHSSDIRVHACVNTRPVIGIGNRNIELAPYNIHYPTLEFHLQVSGINPKLSYWDMPLCLSKEKCVNPLPAQLFSSLSIPFNIQGDTVSNPCTLPPDYAQELLRKTALANASLEKIRRVSDANPEARKLIHSHFREWLVNSGNLRHVLDLLYYEDKDPTP